MQQQAEIPNEGSLNPGLFLFTKQPPSDVGKADTKGEYMLAVPSPDVLNQQAQKKVENIDFAMVCCFLL